MIDRRTGAIPQLAVVRTYHHRGIARSILGDLVEATESDQVCVLNVDERDRASQGFLEAAGFERFVDQVEMVLAL